MRHLKYLLLIVVLLFSVFFVTGCLKKKSLDDGSNVSEVEEVLDMSKYNKEIEKYQLISNKNKLDFGIAKNLGYQEKSKTDSTIVLENTNDLSTIEIKFLYVKSNDGKISKDESEFDLDKYFDYSNVDFGRAKGWQIFYTKDNTTNYQSAFKLTDVVDGYVYAVTIDIKQSSKKDGDSFKVQKFVQSADFQYLLYSMKVTENK